MGTVQLLTSEESLLEQMQIIEMAGRTCYESYEGRNMDIGTGRNFIEKIIKMGHESVIEHSLLSVLFRGFSRGFSHQIVRHRLCSFSQRSTRYVSEIDFAFVRPEGWEDKVVDCEVPGRNVLNGSDDSVVSVPLDDVEDFMRSVYKGLVKAGERKDLARQYLPIGVETEIVVSANFREWRHIFKERLSRRAHWEIRSAINRVLADVHEICHPVFSDFEVDQDELGQVD